MFVKLLTHIGNDGRTLRAESYTVLWAVAREFCQHWGFLCLPGTGHHWRRFPANMVGADVGVQGPRGRANPPRHVAVVRGCVGLRADTCCDAASAATTPVALLSGGSVFGNRAGGTRQMWALLSVQHPVDGSGLLEGWFPGATWIQACMGW